MAPSDVPRGSHVTAGTFGAAKRRVLEESIETASFHGRTVRSLATNRKPRRIKVQFLPTAQT
jgi:hypothetical protein